MKNEKLYEKWENIKIIRKVVNAAMEAKRANKDIGSSLEADVKIYLKKEYLQIVKDFDLPENFITSKAEARELTEDNALFKLEEVKDVGVIVKKAEGKKCQRCWKIFLGSCIRCGTIN